MILEPLILAFRVLDDLKKSSRNSFRNNRVEGILKSLFPSIGDAGCATLRVIAADECPETFAELDIANCATSGLVVGDLCEGDGECGTDPGLNNCQSADMYALVGPVAAPYAVALATVHGLGDGPFTARRRLAGNGTFCDEFLADFEVLESLFRASRNPTNGFWGTPSNSSKFSFRRQIEFVSHFLLDRSSSLPELSTTGGRAPQNFCSETLMLKVS